MVFAAVAAIVAGLGAGFAGVGVAGGLGGVTVMRVSLFAVICLYR